jgi:ABC-type Fe3+-siderophore transport system permease subunit
MTGSADPVTTRLESVIQTLHAACEAAIDAEEAHGHRHPQVPLEGIAVAFPLPTLLALTATLQAVHLDHELARRLSTEILKTSRRLHMLSFGLAATAIAISVLSLLRALW